MKTLLLTVDYTSGTFKNGRGAGDFWADSYIKNTEVTQKEKETIHDTVKRTIEEKDYAEVCYNGRPQFDIFVDTKSGDKKQIGYGYRVKHYIADRSSNFSGDVYFDAWVSIKQAEEIELKPVNNY